MSGSKIAGAIEGLQDSAAQFGGQCLHQFSQSLMPVSAWIGKNQQTKDGICRMLPARWVVELRKREPRFWSALLDRTGEVNSTFIATIMMQQINPGRLKVNEQGVPRDDGETDASIFDYLRASGIKQTKRNVQIGRNATEAAAEVFEHFSVQATMLPSYRLGIYMALKVDGTQRSHALAALFEADGSVRLMDPNLGDFWFPDGDAIANWLRRCVTRLYRDYNKMNYVGLM
jgi:hypothetical protein